MNRKLIESAIEGTNAPVQLVKESVNESRSDPRLKKLSKNNKTLLAQMANTYETTGGPYLNGKSVTGLTRSAVEETLQKAEAEVNEDKIAEASVKRFKALKAALAKL